VWRAHLNLQTWPEVLRQVALVCGAGEPRRAAPMYMPGSGTCAGAQRHVTTPGCTCQRRHSWGWRQPVDDRRALPKPQQN
jgi:hypothetical protein